MMLLRSVQPALAGALKTLSAVIVFALLSSSMRLSSQAQTNLPPGTRTVLDAHNCYPYEGRWSDRIDRALATGTPVAIEQDLFWYADPRSHQSRSVLAHTPVFHGDEPDLESYFFARIRPIMEAEMAHPNPAKWPIITLNLDIKTEELDHLRAIWKVLEGHRKWLTTAMNASDASAKQPLQPGPILVLAGPSDRLEQVFLKEVPVGGRLLVFGAVHTKATNAHTPPEQLETERATNYRRWWNNSWAVVEEGGPSKAADWSPALNARLRQMVEHAHDNGLWIRFYTLDGATAEEQSANGWFRTYNFSSLAAAKARWEAVIDAGADYLATDQYQPVKDAMEAVAQMKSIKQLR